MFIFIYPIAVIIIALILKKRKGNFPLMIALTMIMAILGIMIFIVAILDQVYLSLDYIPLIKISEYLYLFSVICLLIHFIWPYKGRIANAVVALLRYLIYNQVILAIIILVTTYIYSFLTDKTLIINIGYFLSGLLFSIFILRLVFSNNQKKVTIALWFLALLSIISALLNKVMDGYEIYALNITHIITNISVISFFVIILIKVFKKLFK